MCVCEHAALLPAELRTTNFIHFFEIARVAPINRQVCAQLQGGGGREATRQGEWHHLATCSRFTPDLHFGSVRCALQEATPGQEQLDLARLGAGFSATSQAEKEKEQALAEEEAFSRSGSNEGALVASG